MTEARIRGDELTSILLQSTVLEWLTTFGLIFGGCCSNAWAMEILASQNPHTGSLVTFAQFLFVALYGLRKQLTIDFQDDTQATLDRKELLNKVAKNIIRFSSSKEKPGTPVLATIVGPSSISRLFAEELEGTIQKITSHLTIVKHVNGHGQSDSLSSEIQSLDNSGSLNNSLILVYGEDIQIPPLLSQRTYSILLETYSQQWPKTDYYILERSLTVDPSFQNRPVTIFPASFPSKRRWSLRDSPNILMRLRFKTPKIPISRWAAQVMLFFISSMLNNAAFGYNVPMSVHIIFRSGGLVVNMLMGWLIGGQRYNATQIISVLLVTGGVACTTLSASSPSPHEAASTSAYLYLIGIMILTLALVVSGFMGLLQDKVYTQYGRGHWEESMFYLHFLALPGFSLVWRDIVNQIRTVNSSQRVEIGLETMAISLHQLFQAENVIAYWLDMPILRDIWRRRITIPSFYIPLLVNVMTQLLCVSGVNRLTSQVSSLTVTLVLVVRKAVSLGISVVVLQRGTGEGGLLWTGAGLVLVGTLGYTIGTSERKGRGASTAKKEQ